MWLKLVGIALAGLSVPAASAQDSGTVRRAPERVNTTISAACSGSIVALQYRNGYRGNPSKFLALTVDGRAVPGARNIVQSIARSREIYTAEVMYCSRDRKSVNADIVINFSRDASASIRLPSVSVFHLKNNALPHEKGAAELASAEEAISTSDAVDLMSVDPRLSFRTNLDPADLGSVAKHVRISSVDRAKWATISQAVRGLSPRKTTSILPDVRIGLVFYRHGAPIFSLFSEKPGGSSERVPAYLNGGKVDIATSALDKLLSLASRHE